MKFSIVIFLLSLVLGLKLQGQDLRLIEEKYNAKNMESAYYVLKHDQGTKHGNYISYWYGNIVKEQGQYFQNLKDGEWILFDNRGAIAEKQYFDKGTKTGIWQKFVESGQVIKRFDQSQGIELEPYFNVHYRYPALARELGVEGTVKIEYQLDDNCDLRTIGVVGSLDKDCDQAAIDGTKRLLLLMKKYSSPTCDTLNNVVKIKFRLSE